MLIPTTPNPELEELERLGDEIALLSAHIEAATARLLDLIRDFDARGGWGNGFKSCAEWLAWRVGMDLGAARERVRVARALPNLPRLAAALAHSELSYAKVRALTRVATPETEERLLAFAKAGTAAHVERLVRGWRRVDRNAEHQETALRHRSRALHVYRDEDGMMVVRGRLTPEVGAVLRQALAAACDRIYAKARVNDPEGDPPSLGQQQADALGMIAEAALHHDLDPGAPGERYQVVVHVDAPALADPAQPGQSVLEDGDHVSAETSRRLACDARRVLMRHDPDGRVAEVGARTRTIPPCYAVRWSIETMAVASPDVDRGLRRGITSNIGPKVGRRHYRTSRCSAGVTIARCTRKASRSSAWPTASCNSAGRMAG